MESVSNWLRSWKLLSWRTAVLAAVVIYALVGFFLVPVIAKKLIVDTVRERTGREATVEEVRCNPFTLSLTIRGFSFPDRPGSTMLSFDEFYANAQVSSIFRWAATLKDFRVENPYVGLRRFADGGINVLELMDDIEERTPPEEEPDAEGGLPRALLQHILVANASFDVEDRAIPEPVLMKFGPSKLELHDISTIPDREGTNEFVIGLQRGGEIRVTGDVVVEPFGLDGAVTADNIFLDAAWPAIKHKFEFDLLSGKAAGKLRYSVQIQDDGLHATIDDVDYRVEGLAVQLRDPDTKILEVPSITITDGSLIWPEAALGAGAVVVEGADLFMWIEPDGTPGWEALVPKETQEEVVKTYQQVQEAFPWEIVVDRFEIKSASVRLEDRTFPEPVELGLENANLVLTDIVTQPGVQWGLKASALLFGEAQAGAEGFVGTGPMRLEIEVSLSDLNLANFQPYISKTAPVQLLAGVLGTSGTARLDPKGDGPMASFAGDLTIHEIDLKETLVGSRVLQWGRVEIKGIDAACQPISLKVNTIDILGAGIEVVVSEDGRINLIEMFASMAEKSEGKEKTEMPPIEVKALTLHGCSSAYTDRTLTPPFTLALDPVDGTVKGVSTTATAGAKIDIKGPVRTGGMVKIDGEMDLIDPKRLTDLSIDVRQAVMPPITPMSVRYIGHPIDEGKVDITLKYEITNSDLVGSNKFVTDGLALGDKVEGEGMVNLPFKLGVSLLTDKNGLITLEFPIEGNLDDPAFGLGNAIGSAATEITSELIKSPFRLLGKLGGGSGDEDLGFVEFEAGSAELEVTASDRLSTLAAGAEQRPELVLLVEGAWDEGADAAALKEAAFEAAVAEKLGSTAGAEEVSPSLDLLESLYRESASGEGLNALRAQNMTADESTGEQVLDETTYYRDLSAALIEAQPVDMAAVQALAGARAEAVRAFLVDGQGIDPTRLRIIDPVAAEEPSDDDWVRCRLDVETGG